MLLAVLVSSVLQVLVVSWASAPGRVAVPMSGDCRPGPPSPRLASPPPVRRQSLIARALGRLAGLGWSIECESFCVASEARDTAIAASVTSRSLTLRATRTVFDPARQAMAEGRCRAWRKQIWQPIDEMAPWDLASEADSDSGG